MKSSLMPHDIIEDRLLEKVEPMILVCGKYAGFFHIMCDKPFAGGLRLPLLLRFGVIDRLIDRGQSPTVIACYD